MVKKHLKCSKCGTSIVAKAKSLKEIENTTWFCKACFNRVKAKRAKSDDSESIIIITPFAKTSSALAKLKEFCIK